jgi:hypothetical protein
MDVTPENFMIPESFHTTFGDLSFSSSIFFCVGEEGEKGEGEEKKK